MSPLFFVELYVAIALSLERWRKRDTRGEIWKRIAFVTRYGHITLTEALTMPVADMRDYAQALSELVKGENEAIKPS